MGGAMVKRLKSEGHWIRGIDQKYHNFFDISAIADEFIQGDLRNPSVCAGAVTNDIDEIYQFAADMGGAGFVFSGENDADIMHNSAMINLNVVEASVKAGVKKIFYSSSACMYPERNQMDPDNPNCKEDSAYPAEPDSEYGWEKLFSERFFLAANRNYGLDVRIARFHNIFGPEGSWDDGREKAPAAFCRKVAETPDGGVIEMWGDGEQTRSFLYIDECLEGVCRLMESDFMGPVNIGSEEMVSINQLAEMAMDIAGKKLNIKHIPGPLGVRGRNSDNRLIKEKLGWEPNWPLRKGMEIAYKWIAEQVQKREEK
ncbi:MAG TPA: NAD-dependent epimerase/dehydratase family protein [Candidatus Marinimicrobia bacterium]|nr:NAD-dependent epimerase/dehydratase family protein [Candidatus Neomarinimicrobiota bacterium]